MKRRKARDLGRTEYRGNGKRMDMHSISAGIFTGKSNFEYMYMYIDGRIKLKCISKTWEEKV
jgi:hypothetical protein